MNYIVRRMVTYVAVLVIVSNIIFFLPRFTSGNYCQITSNIQSTAFVQLCEARLNINAPLYVQYAQFLRNTFATWPPNFGLSFQYYPQSVTSLFASRVGWTMSLIAASFVLSLAIAYAMAVITSTRRGGKFEMGSLYVSILANSTPVFWIAIVVLWIFAVDLHAFPIFGNVSPGATGFDYFSSSVYHAVLPILALTLVLFGQNYLILRGSVQEAMKSDYVLAAQTRGLRDRLIATGYILRNSLLPLVSVSSFALAGLVGRAVLVETIFGYNGLGDLVVDAAVNRDLPVLEGSIFLLTVIIIAFGLIGDVVMLKLDPRLRH